MNKLELEAQYDECENIRKKQKQVNKFPSHPPIFLLLNHNTSVFD